MTEITVRQLTADEWRLYRDVRLAALTEAPAAFTATLDEEQRFDEEIWRDRMSRSVRLLAHRDDAPIGIVSVGDQPAEDGEPQDTRRGELFGLWVVPEQRGTGVASVLVRAAMDLAVQQDRSHLAYWVSTENGRAVAFASSYGFLPTDERRPMRGPSHEGEQEIMMVIPLSPDRGSATLLSPTLN